MTQHMHGKARHVSSAEPSAPDRAGCLAEVPAYLWVREGERTGARFPLAPTVTTIGRDPDNVIRFDSAAVSRRHARVYPDGPAFVIEDLGSTNGTYVNGARLEVSRPWPLHQHDYVSIGVVTLEFVNEETLKLLSLRLDRMTARVWVNGRPVRIVGRAYHALELLDRRQGEVITKDDLIETLWPRKRPENEDHALEQVISRVRRALGESRRAPQHLITVPGIGYKLLTEPAEAHGRRGG